MSSSTRTTAPEIMDGLVLFWVKAYTIGLADATRERRIGQIRSDLWEHYADRRGQGSSPALIRLEALGRAARGVAADLFWRFGLEEPQMQLNIPLERLGGACLLILVAAVMLSMNVNGYDPNVEGFDGELRRLASIKGWQVGIYTALQVLSGIAMLIGAVVLYLMLRRYSTMPIIFASVALASAGLLTLMTSALYATAANLADEYVATAPENRQTVLTVSRAFVLMMNGMVPTTGVMLGLSIFGYGAITTRYRLVPHWLRFVAGGGALALVLALITGLAADTEATWAFVMLGFLLLLLWLLVAGVWLLFGGSNEIPMEQTSRTPDEPLGRPA